MKAKVTGVLFGIGFGFVLAWARLTDPVVIRNMLLLREADVFLVMGSAVAVAAVGVRLLRAAGARALVTGEKIAWTKDRPGMEHVVGSAVFGAGWCLAGTCPGPVAAMIGEGKMGGLVVAAGLLGGVTLQAAVQRMLAARRAAAPVPGTARRGLRREAV